MFVCGPGCKTGCCSVYAGELEESTRLDCPDMPPSKTEKFSRCGMLDGDCMSAVYEREMGASYTGDTGWYASHSD